MIVYLLKSGVCLAAFFLFYKLFLEKENLHVFKRFYLIGGLVLAFVIPLMTFTTIVDIEPIEYIPYTISDIPIEQQMTPEVSTINYIPIILWTVYGFGVVLFGLKFLFNLFQIGNKIRNNPNQKTNQFTHVLLQHLITPHTFFSYIFLNKQQYEQQQIPQEVFWHEETHAKQKHSFDVVFVELLQVVFWFNPLLHFIKIEIKLNHEFLADSAVLNKGVSLSAYQEILLAFSSNQSEPQLANAINYSSIKKRFTVMKTKTSKKAIWIKSLILLPLIAVLVYGFSEQRIVEIENNINTLSQDVNISSTINNIEILIDKHDELLVNEVKTEIDSLEKRLAKINPNISIENRRNIIANVHTNENTKKGIITDIKKTFRKYGIIKMNIDGSNKIISESNQLIIPKPKKEGLNKATYYHNVTFIFRDANKNVISTKKYNELNEEEKSKLLPPRKVPMKKSPSQNQLYEWKDSKKYGVWLDGKRIENKALKDISPKEIVLFYNSKLAKNAKNYGKHYFQIGLYTNNKFDELYKDGIKPLGKNVEIVITKHSHIKIQRTKQDKATPQEMAEYNKLAKNYNAMSKNDMVLKIKDVERLEFIYNKMTHKQKNDAESFPNFPPMPPPVKIGQEEIIEVPMTNPPPPPPIPKNATPEEKERMLKAIQKYAKENPDKVTKSKNKKGQIVEIVEMPVEDHELIPPPPPPAPNQKTINNGSKKLQKAFKEFSESSKLYGKSVQKYRTTEKGLSDIEDQYKKALELHKVYRELATAEGLLPKPPPPPPTPPNPTDHMIDMAKKGALFYYEDKKISSDKAIEIVKKNNSINIQVLSEGSSKPIVKLSKQPITIKE